MKNIEYSTFYKFMVSLGLALLVLAFAGPWLLLREPFPLLTKSSELKLLTPRAQSVIDERQRLAERSNAVIPWASSVLFILGLGVTTVGVTRWNHRQKVLDEKENLENEKLRREVRELPAEEAEERIIEEAKRTVEAETRYAEKLGLHGPSEGERYVETLASLFTLERRAIDHLRSALRTTHMLEYRVAVADASVDARLRAIAQEPDYLFELKYFRSSTGEQLAEEAVKDIAQATETFSQRTNPDTAGLLLVILGKDLVTKPNSNGEDREKSLQIVNEILDKSARSSMVTIRAVAVSEEQFLSMSAENTKRLLFAA